MVKPPYYDRHGIKKGAWSEEEDNKLKACIERLGHVPNWRLLPMVAGLKRCGKSCRLRWLNYLKPGLKKEKVTKQEEDLIIQIHNQLGNKWSAIAAKLPGRTDNDIKNYWHAHILKRNGRVVRAVNTRNAKEQSSESNSCITTGLNQEEAEKAENMVRTAVSVSDNTAAEIMPGVDLHQEEELYGLGLWQDYDIITDYSGAARLWQDYDDIITHYSDPAKYFQEDLLIGEECYLLGLW